VDTLIVDKTGTLTEGKPVFDCVVPATDFTAETVLQLAASVEQGSEHPLAAAIVQQARSQALLLHTATAFQSDTGMGVTGVVAGKNLALGNVVLMQKLGIATDSLHDDAETLRRNGASVMHLAVDGNLAGLLAVSDPIKSSTADALRSLRAAGIRVVMATGDSVDHGQCRCTDTRHHGSARRSDTGRQTGAGRKMAAQRCGGRDGG
jgi:Cu+-exporting ATPase